MAKIASELSSQTNVREYLFIKREATKKKGGGEKKKKFRFLTPESSSVKVLRSFKGNALGFVASLNFSLKTFHSKENYDRQFVTGPPS